MLYEIIDYAALRERWGIPTKIKLGAEINEAKIKLICIYVQNRIVIE